jgi:DNA-binding transcriptional MerR regulator
MAAQTGASRTPAQASSLAGTGSARPVFSIGQVLAKLQPEFPDLTPSKLRFLEDQDLVTPFRTPSSYRKFSTEDVDRLRLILTLQRDQYLPLKVIKEHLDAMASGKASALPTATGLAASSVLSTRVRYTPEETIKAAGATANLMQDAVSAGLIAPAEKEFALIERALAPLAKRQGPASRAKSIERANEIAVFMETVRSQILRQVISRNSGQA